MFSYLQQKILVAPYLVLITMLSGCGAYGGAIAGAALSGAITGAGLSSHDPKPPELLCTSDDSIGVKYYYEGSEFATEKAKRLIFEHCGGQYEVTHHVKFMTSGEMFATCLQVDRSQPTSPSCKYIAPEPGLVGFGNTDPANETW